jgi:hypothetical protein
LRPRFTRRVSTFLIVLPDFFQISAAYLIMFSLQRNVALPYFLHRRLRIDGRRPGIVTEAVADTWV